MAAKRRSPAHLRWFRRLLRLFPAEFRSDFGDDMQADFADEYREARRTGPAAAAAVWCRTLPGLLRAAVREHADAFVNDARFALRLMARTPGFTVAALLMIALGTGANAAMFSVIDAVLLQSSFTDPARVVQVAIEGGDGHETAGISRAQYDALREHEAVLGEIAARGSSRSPVLTGAGEPQRFDPECVTASAFRVLGTAPLSGRTFSDAEERTGAPVAVVSEPFWRRAMGGAPDALGREILLNGRAITVIGIMPHGFAGPYSRDNVDGWLPIALPPLTAPSGRRTAAPLLNEAERPVCVADGTLSVFARLRPHVAYAAAAQQMTGAAGVARLPDWQGRTGGRVVLHRLENVNVTELRTPLLALVGAVGFVLLIACANVANLQLERAVGRRRELAVRMAIGATRGRVLRQSLTETLLLYVAGCAAGIVAATWTLHAIVALLPAGVPRIDDVAVNGRVLGATLALSCVAGIAVGFVPAVMATSHAMVGDIRVSTPTASRAGAWMRRGLVIGQVALSLTLTVGAGLMVRTFLTLRPVHPGFVAGGKVTAIVAEHSAALEPPVVFYRRLFDRLSEIPGVQAVSGSTYLPMSGMVDSGRVSAGATTLSAWRSAVTPNYCSEMQIRIVRGRDFSASDDATAPPVVIVNETFARRAWPNRDPIGDVVILSRPGAAQLPRRVIGVAADTRSLGGDLTTRPEVYMPFAQSPSPYLNVILRTSDPFDPRLAAEIRAAAAAIDPLQVVERIQPLQDMLDVSVSTPRFGAWLLGAFAAMAVLLAAAGLAASIGWWVAQRTREIGVRMALGARPGDVAGIFVRQGLGLAAVGVLIGLAGAAIGTRLLQSWLYGVRPLDAPTFAASAGALLVIALAAAYLPARCAARVDPLIALRTE
jgi:putative ABC transport system permease protein